MDETLLHGSLPDWSGLAAVERPRTPPAHYHRFDLFVQQDSFNDCTRSGCHAPLPHAGRKEVRAFLNMHATSIHCGVCHMDAHAAADAASTASAQPLPLAWYRLVDGQPTDSPALLAAAGWLERRLAGDSETRGSRAEQLEIVRLLERASRDAGGIVSLDRIAEHLRAVRAESPAFMRLLESARDAVDRSFRGHYGAKLALRDAAGRPILRHAGTEQAVKNYLREAKQATAARRDSLVAAVHPRKRERPLNCTDCHRAEGSLIDFPALGFSSGRVRSLFNPAVFRMIENIAHGQPFHLPRFTRPSDAEPNRTEPRP